MKKTTLKIVFLICIAFVFATILWFMIIQSKNLHNAVVSLNFHRDMLQRKLSNPTSSGNSLEELEMWVDECVQSVQILSVQVSVCGSSLAACVFLFVYCNPRLFRLSTWTNLSEEWAKNKAERAARKQAKSETDKQKRIEELQKELDALKKDDAPPSQE